MDIKKKVPTNTITRDVKNLAAPTGNIYETVVILYKRANMIAAEEKKELTKKLEDFKNDRDTMDEVFENREQIEFPNTTNAFRSRAWWPSLNLRTVK